LFPIGGTRGNDDRDGREGLSGESLAPDCFLLGNRGTLDFLFNANSETFDLESGNLRHAIAEPVPILRTNAVHLGHICGAGDGPRNSNDGRYRSVSLGPVGEHAIGSQYLRVLSCEARKDGDCTHVPCFSDQFAGVSGGCDRTNPTGECTPTILAEDAVGVRECLRNPGLNWDLQHCGTCLDL